jgi:hypothetical protein
MNVLVIPEDFRKDQYLLEPIIGALAQLPDITALRDVLRPRWEQVRDGDWLTESEEHTNSMISHTSPTT